MVLKKKLPLAVVIAMSTMLMMHVFMPLNLHANESELEEPTSQTKRAVNLHELEACPEEGDLLPEETPFWSDKFEEYKKPKYELEMLGENPAGPCCAPDNTTKKSFGYIEPPKYTDKCKNPCWYDGKRLRCVPYFFIIGASKSATTDLFQRLLIHPNIKSTRKEIHWFNRLRTLGAGLKWYTSQFNSVAKDINSKIKEGENPKTVIGEVSIDYLSDVHVWEHFTGNQGCYEPRVTIASHVRFVDPKARIIVNLRDPIKRLYSNYLYRAAAREKLKDPSTQKMHELVQRAVMAYKECFKRLPARACLYNRTLSKLHPIDIASGAYAPFVEDWLRAFGKQQMYVVKFEDYEKDMAKSTQDVVKFLDLPPYPDVEFDQIKSMAKYVQNVYYKIAPMQNRTIKLLRDFYTPFNIRLSKMLKDERFMWK